MPTFRQRFTGNAEEDFPAPPIARRLQPGDVIEYDADEPIEHARLELVADEPPADWERLTLHWPGAAVVRRALAEDPASDSGLESSTAPPRTRKNAAASAPADKED